MHVELTQCYWIIAHLASSWREFTPAARGSHLLPRRRRLTSRSLAVECSGNVRHPTINSQSSCAPFHSESPPHSELKTRSGSRKPRDIEHAAAASNHKPTKRCTKTSRQ